MIRLLLKLMFMDHQLLVRGRFRIIDATGPNGGTERFAIGPNGEIGLGYVV